MSYVKLIAKPDTWFKSGTEVYDYDCDAPDDLRRVTLADWEKHEKEWRQYGGQGGFIICVRGIRVIEAGYEEKLFGAVGTERWDGEACSSHEFEVEIVEEPR